MKHMSDIVFKLANGLSFEYLRPSHFSYTAWSSGLRHQSVITLLWRSWVQISAPPLHFHLDKTNNEAANNKEASNNNGAAEARSRRLKRKADD
jgi:hypothetical protein